MKEFESIISPFKKYMKRICTYDFGRTGTEKVNEFMQTVANNIQDEVNKSLKEIRDENLVKIAWNNTYDREENPDLTMGHFIAKAMKKA
jgi:hypothetical protein